MLLTLAASSLKPLLDAKGEDALSLFDLPRFAIERLELRGLNMPTSMLAGWGVAEIDRLRDEGDRAGCPCLLLIEDEPMHFGSPTAKKREAAAARFAKLLAAAQRLGCASIALACAGDGSDACLDKTIESLRAAMATLDRREINILLRPGGGLGDDPTRLTDLIKRVGGFRIGSMPDFGHAQRSGDAEATLRKLAPYAGAVHATISGFDAEGAHRGCDLFECVQAIRSVGYANTLGIEYAGDGDPVTDIQQARRLLESALEAEATSS